MMRRIPAASALAAAAVAATTIGACAPAFAAPTPPGPAVHPYHYTYSRTTPGMTHFMQNSKRYVHVPGKPGAQKIISNVNVFTYTHGRHTIRNSNTYVYNAATGFRQHIIHNTDTYDFVS